MPTLRIPGTRALPTGPRQTRTRPSGCPVRLLPLRLRRDLTRHEAALGPRRRRDRAPDLSRPCRGLPCRPLRAAADWLEGALDNGEFTLDEQLVQLLKAE
ncbi:MULTISPECIES: DUF6192 family protein [unclassified Streptomyces]|uniref:DUF6192 family protein n=1 Tax=unclassified Streptomyces TaxID=2593676 RepID=UPI0033199B6A